MTFICYNVNQRGGKTMIGERLKAARHGAGLSQRDLAKAVGVSAMAISKYERGLDVPGSGIVIKLAQALKVKTEYLFRPSTVTLRSPAYRRRASLPRKQENIVLGRIQEWLERYLDVEKLVGQLKGFTKPEGLNCRVDSLDEVEEVALGLRRAWHLGEGPIENLSEVLEDQGIKVGMVEAHEDFDAVTFWADGESPVIVVKSGLPGDRQRFSLAHELGHLILEPTERVDAEKASYRFAGAFLVPRPAALSELGEQRGVLDFYELHLLKDKYGLSMQAWIYRARDLGIVSERTAAGLFRLLRQRGWHLEEPGEAFLSEEPKRMKRLVMHALAEDIVSESRAAELLGMPIRKFWKEEAEKHAGFPAGLRAGR
jgi:Zn-dependent peptidase ImmA (M78 family)/transcriptional regulator with XRE-family HTH domain